MTRKLLLIIILSVPSLISLSQENTFYINGIYISGNRITKEKIILRELLFQTGDSIALSDLEKKISDSRENLINTSLFNFVTITRITAGKNDLAFLISVEERWYTWPRLILQYEDRNFSAWLKEGDLSRTSIGGSVEQFNCFGRKENLKVSVAFGFAEQFMLSYRNVALDKGRRHFAGAEFEYSKQNEIFIDTRDNKPQTFKYDLTPVLNFKKYTLNYLYRPFIYFNHNVFINYKEFSLADTVIAVNPDYLFAGNKRLNCFTLDYVLTMDKRDSKAYPLSGSFFAVLTGHTISAPFSKDSFSSTVISPSFTKYFEINNRFHFASGVNMKFSYNNTYSFLYSRALGYNVNMHGFEYNTIEGEHFVLLRNLFKVTILQPTVYSVPLIPFKKFSKIHYAFYFNLFTDCGYVSSKYNRPDNNYANRFLISAGAGIDFVTYYDRTIRAEYSVNGFGQGGFYLNLTAPI